jgi:hypothetical protein
MSTSLADELRLDEPGRIAHLSIVGLAFLLAYLPTLAVLHAKENQLDRPAYGHGPTKRGRGMDRHIGWFDCHAVKFTMTIRPIRGQRDQSSWRNHR